MVKFVLREWIQMWRRMALVRDEVGHIWDRESLKLETSENGYNWNCGWLKSEMRMAILRIENGYSWNQGWQKQKMRMSTL